MQADLYNMYVERLLKEIEELTKNRLLVDTQLKFTEKMNADLQIKVQELEAQLEKQVKKSSKKSAPDPESSSLETF